MGRMATPRRPRDINQLAKLILDISTGEVSDPDPNVGKNPAAIERGRAGGLKGGAARAKSLSKRKREAIARQAAKVRWKDKQ